MPTQKYGILFVIQQLQIRRRCKNLTSRATNLAYIVIKFYNSMCVQLEIYVIGKIAAQILQILWQELKQNGLFFVEKYIKVYFLKEKSHR